MHSPLVIFIKENVGHTKKRGEKVVTVGPLTKIMLLIKHGASSDQINAQNKFF